MHETRYSNLTMSEARKRSFAEFSEEEPPHTSGVADTLHRIRNGEDSIKLDEASEGWTPVISKSKKRKSRGAKQKRRPDGHDAQSPLQDLESRDLATQDKDSQTQQDGTSNTFPIKAEKQSVISTPKDNRPGLNFVPHRLNSILKLANLQELILYCIADAIAPSWISVKHHNQVRRAVALFVPGLEQAMFTGKLKLEPSTILDDGDGHARVESKANGTDASKQGVVSTRGTRNPDDFLPMPLVSDQLPAALKPLAEIFPHIWPVKAPGDDKYSKVHSPLHAMLTTHIPRRTEEKKEKGPKAPRTDKDWIDEPTPVTSYLLPLEDMRENEYVLHPAHFSGLDELQSHLQNRKATGTSLEDGWQNTIAKQLEHGETTYEQVIVNAENLSVGRNVFAMDCEMCVVEGGEYALTRLSIVGWDGEVVIDKLVKPEKPITDYVTRFSGMTKEMLDPVTTTLQDIQRELIELFSPQTILIGHSLDSDLRALKLTHPFLIDTAILYPHPRGAPLKSSLKWLAQKYLGRNIQKGDGSVGHDSIEDAKACLDLVRQKCQKGPLWGTSEASSEPIFKRLSRTPVSRTTGGNSSAKTGAIVDVGEAKRGFRTMAQYSIGCQADADVVTGVRRCVLGDKDGMYIPGGGVDFTWARFRALEKLRGWANDNRSAEPSDGAIWSEPSPAELNAAVAELVAHIKAIRDFLPPCTLFVVYSGTGDPRELARLQEMQRTYKREYQVKKWDELSVKWTDTEEQALKEACTTARAGIGFMCVT